MRQLQWIAIPAGLLALPLTCLAVPVKGGPAPAPGAFEKTVRPFLTKHCSSCHSAKARTGDIDTESLKTAATVAKDPHSWEKIAQKVKTGEMPPPGSPRPSPAEVKAFTGWVEGEFLRLEKAAKPDPGRVTARRLNRAEYNNTVRDLLGVEVRPADDFPQDDSGYGFDNIGDVLSLSPALMERYLSAAERVSRAALFGVEPGKPTIARYRPPDREYDLVQKPEAQYDETGLSMPQAVHVTHRFPVEGEYVIRPSLGGSRPLSSEPVEIGVWIDGKLARTAKLDPEGAASFYTDKQDFAGKVQEVRVRVPAGEHWVAASIMRIYEGLPASYGGPHPSTRPAPPAPDFSRLKPPPDATPEQLERFERRLKVLRDRPKEVVPANEVRVRGIEIQGPYHAKAAPTQASRQRVFTCGHLTGVHQPGCERRVLSSLGRRAFRRPLKPGELDRYLRLFSLAREQGESFEEGLSVAIQGLLVSPHFLFRMEPDSAAAQPGTAQPVGQHALASRLSYFLWSSMPDDELLNLADQGALAKPVVLEAQVRRMLKDPKSTALVENFGGQWLELRKLDSVRPDRERFKEWDDYLRTSMRQETERFFQHIVQQDASILDFLDARYTFLNERLANFYGIPGVDGVEFRKVDLTGTRRGGLLTQASVLTVSSYATRTSPVLRGKWILDNVLNSPPPPPPPNVPNLDEAKVDAGASLRVQLEEHRKNPTCASCHSRLDPLGFALENYNAIGQWREKEGSTPIDTSALLPDGRTFSGPDGLKQVLKTDRGAFAECVTEKLLTYALGRGLERYDRPTVRTIAARLPGKDYRFSALVLEIVNSLPFRMRRGETAR